MKKFFLILFIPFTLFAQDIRQFKPEHYDWYIGINNFLHSGNPAEHTPLEILRDTILADGSHSHIYRAMSPCYGNPPNSWCFTLLPDGIGLLHRCFAEFPYPTGMEYGFYNFVPDLVKVVDRKYGIPTVETEHYQMVYEPPAWERPSKPEPEPEPKEEIHDIPDDSSPQISSCSIQVRGKTIPLYGRVQVVNAFADFRVEVVPFSADLKVQAIDRMPMYCGEWQFVDSTPDFTIEYVPFSADLQIEFVDALPGMP